MIGYKNKEGLVLSEIPLKDRFSLKADLVTNGGSLYLLIPASFAKEYRFRKLETGNFYPELDGGFRWVPDGLATQSVRSATNDLPTGPIPDAVWRQYDYACRGFKYDEQLLKPWLPRIKKEEGAAYQELEKKVDQEFDDLGINTED